MPIFAFLSSLFQPAADIVKSIEATSDDKAKLQNQLGMAQNAVAEKLLDYETKLMQAQADVIKAEAQGASWIQRNWRPISMLTFLVLVVCDSFGWMPNRLAPQAWTLLQIGMGGYLAGKSLENLAPHATKLAGAILSKGDDNG